jgi:glycosyltransferase involved in cell wall biosynthesis
MKANVCIVTFPLGEAGYTPLSNLVKLFSRLSNRVYVVSGDAALEELKNLGFNVQAFKVTHRISSELWMRTINYVHTQAKILNRVIEASGKTDLFVFFMGGEGLVLPMLTLKLLRKKVLLMLGGIATKGYQARKDPFSRFLSSLTSLNFSLADKIILYSRTMTFEANVAKYQNKIIIGHEHFVDFSKFFPEKAFDKRPNVVGYIGRLSEEKGILNLVDAIPLILRRNTKIHFMICGDGSLADRVGKSLQTGGLDANAEVKKWVPHDEVPRYLNDFRLLALPSSTEGLPNILLEAMACGTPILTTSVGAIPDIIRNGETGFLLKSNDAKHTADKIVELFNEQRLLEEVGHKAYQWVRENFSEEETIRMWQGILGRLEMRQANV